MMPQSDVDDFKSGARWIPGEVTEARRNGLKVAFVQPSANSSDWYWEMTNGNRVSHG